MLSAAQIAAMQAVASASLDQVALQQRLTSVSADAWGGQSGTLTTITAALACGLAKPSAQLMQQYAARLANQQAWVARFAAGTDVREGDTLTINGQVFTVQALLTPRSYSVSVQALVSAVR